VHNNLCPLFGPQPTGSSDWLSFKPPPASSRRPLCGAPAGRESAEGLGAEGVQTGEVLVGAS
jgi:hypothetical protein